MGGEGLPSPHKPHPGAPALAAVWCDLCSRDLRQFTRCPLSGNAETGPYGRHGREEDLGRSITPHVPVIDKAA